MQSLNNLKSQIKNDFIYDSFHLSKNTIDNLKSELKNVFLKYTKLKNEDININIKILKTGKYLISFSVCASEFYD